MSMSITADDKSFRPSVAATSKPHTLTIVGLLLPLIVLITVFFLIPTLCMLGRSIYEPDIVRALPRTAAIIGEWQGVELPNQKIAQALVNDLRDVDPATLGKAAKKLNSEIAGFRSLLLETSKLARALEAVPDNPQAWLISVDKRWENIPLWTALSANSSTLTDTYLLRTLDLHYGEGNEIVPVPADERIYVRIVLRTLEVSAVTTVICVLLAFPFAYAAANTRPMMRLVLMTFVLLPFWTSTLVRALAWLVLLQNDGLIVSAFRHFAPDIFGTLHLVHNRFGVYIAMVHTLLPFAVLPIYVAMLNTPPTHVRASFSLGAGPLRTFWKVYLPQVAQGISISAMLVCISALGYYITPALVGGADDQLLSYYIAYYVNMATNWGAAASLSLFLLFIVLMIFLTLQRFAGARDHAK